ncbi:hypothetical protein KVR01_001148 [Diaporthe batatas]|uniref:uncharacterized protein n=1 Tax=Diaporthe batatas TaxID=748121 RepID=UPI001D04B51A|nr:uncharacterized protein KVR01_001148 [Diaporthe batatas]KAG8168399.1 hypothetical protein KVR01_001148 [Diaporthe batatas]
MAPTAQAQTLGPLPQGAVVRYSYGDGYLRTAAVVERERLRRPFNRLRRNQRSREFAESIGTSTDSDILRESPPIRRISGVNTSGELEFYRDHRANAALIDNIVMNFGGGRTEVIRDVLLVFARVITHLDAQRGFQTNPAVMEPELRHIAQGVVDLSRHNYSRMFLNITHRTAFNRYIGPIIRASVSRLWGAGSTFGGETRMERFA